MSAVALASVSSLRPLSLLIGALLASTAQAASPAREDARTLDRLEVRERAPGAYAPLPLEAARLRIEEDDPYFLMIRSQWSQSLHDAYLALPEPPWSKRNGRSKATR